ncbi:MULTISPECIES: DUF397 domain-containing protein [Actinoalloteichus]|uniref:DUF397 domain-containing protein n=1 Tax=Actinoalloteichus caeruleus DSM 43889 TaxID=1120930 RepID=A0ABT1JIA1_ACTCY|nr:DUF397 domain-containing protein [Actinoalloteichus caeruleus]MCP2332012.1 protein of unknown function (DUF397) [Actinoalloteichus caeruleus DSM 43889]
MSTQLPGVRWRKSSRSNGGGNCVEIARRPDVIDVRDSKNPAGPVLTFESAEWRRFLSGIATTRCLG